MITNIIMILFKRSRSNIQHKIHMDRVPKFQRQDPNICRVPPVSSWFIKCSKNTAKISLTMPKKICLGIGAQCTVNVKYLHPEKLMSETYTNKTAHTIVDNLLVIKQDTGVVNKALSEVNTYLAFRFFLDQRRKDRCDGVSVKIWLGTNQQNLPRY